MSGLVRPRAADPTRAEILAAIAEEFPPSLYDGIRAYCESGDHERFPEAAMDVEGAIYWFAADHHDGQFSNLYSALSQSKFRPGRCSSGPEEGEAAAIYEFLSGRFQ